MKLAFLYAGQGTQHIGMGRDLYERCPAFRAVFDSPAAGFDLRKLCFEGTEEQLRQTRFTQPCMAAFAAGVTALLSAEGIVPQAAAGLSLGEYSALHAAGVFDVPTLLSLTAFRGKAMEEAAAGRACAMAAVLGLPPETLAELCRAAVQSGTVEIANRNCPGQMVIAGDAAAVRRAEELALRAGAKRCIPLNVGGPFHTSLMAPAGQALEARFSSVRFGKMRFPMVCNATARPPEDERSIPALLVRQVQSTVRFEDSIRFLARLGIDTALEIGPGKVLSGFVRRTEPSIRTYAAEDAESLHAAVAALKGETDESNR